MTAIEEVPLLLEQSSPATGPMPLVTEAARNVKQVETEAYQGAVSDFEQAFIEGDLPLAWFRLARIYLHAQVDKADHTIFDTEAEIQPHWTRLVGDEGGFIFGYGEPNPIREYQESLRSEDGSSPEVQTKRLAAMQAAILAGFGVMRWDRQGENLAYIDYDLETRLVSFDSNTNPDGVFARLDNHRIQTFMASRGYMLRPQRDESVILRLCNMDQKRGGKVIRDLLTSSPETLLVERHQRQLPYQPTVQQVIEASIPWKGRPSHELGLLQLALAADAQAQDDGQPVDRHSTKVSVASSVPPRHVQARR